MIQEMIAMSVGGSSGDKKDVSDSKFTFLNISTSNINIG